MSRRRVYANGAYQWSDEGESGYRPDRSNLFGGTLVTPGKVRGPAPYIMPIPLTGEALAEARRRYHPHGKGTR